MYGDKQQLVIPTPETKPVDVDTSLIDDNEGDFKMPKQYIHIQGEEDLLVDAIKEPFFVEAFLF